MRAPVRSDPRSWNGRPDGAGEAAMPQQPCRGCHAAWGSTLTSWRSGRLGRIISSTKREDYGPGRRVPKTERAEGAGAGFRAGCARTALTRPTATSQPDDARGHHTQAPVAAGLRAAQTRCDSPESLDAFGRPDAQASTDTPVSLVESLILAQDQRWRRA